MFLNLQHHHCHQGRVLGQDWLTAAYIPYTWQEAVKMKWVTLYKIPCNMKIIHYIEDQYHLYIQLQDIGRWQNLDWTKWDQPLKPLFLTFLHLVKYRVWPDPVQSRFYQRPMSCGFMYQWCRSWIYRVNFILHEIVSISAWNYTGFKANNYDYYIPLIAHSNN